MALTIAWALSGSILLASTFFSLMDRMGVKLDSFGDATTRLEGL